MSKQCRVAPDFGGTWKIVDVRTGESLMCGLDHRVSAISAAAKLGYALVD